MSNVRRRVGSIGRTISSGGQGTRPRFSGGPVAAARQLEREVVPRCSRELAYHRAERSSVELRNVGNAPRIAHADSVYVPE
jgi:hypothetical protein